MEREGWKVRMSLPSSTIDIKWPMAGDGNITTASSIAGLSICSFDETKRCFV
uniref:Uncharacterized protein n=1 Tax=Manihot esculenta TaxID=3983 RepID=A0A199UBM5_MANES